MSPVLRHILGTVVAAGAVTGLGFLVRAARAEQHHTACREVRIAVVDSLDKGFVTVADVEEFLGAYGPVIGQRLDSVDLGRIERMLAYKSAIRGSEAYLTRDGVLTVEVTQREPVVRFQKGAHGFYADAEGFIFPLHPSYTAPVPVVDGAVPLIVGEGFKGMAGTEEEMRWLADMVAMLGYMKRSRVWAEQVARITVAPSGDLVLTPRTGREQFIFGAPQQVEEKFRKIEEYYEAVAPSQPADHYGTVDVKYAGQIICRE